MCQCDAGVHARVGQLSHVHLLPRCARVSACAGHRVSSSGEPQEGADRHCERRDWSHRHPRCHPLGPRYLPYVSIFSPVRDHHLCMSSDLLVLHALSRTPSRDDGCMRECVAVWCRAAKDQVWQDHAPHPQKDR